jgi:hypothetical protein
MLSASTAWAGLSKLDALSMIESGNNDAAIGEAGEVSRYQIKPWIWREYSKSKAYRDARLSAQVAEQYLADLEETFRKRARREPNDFDLYVLWNAGPAYYAKCTFSPGRIHPIIRERARRFVNLRRMERPARLAAKPATNTDQPRSLLTLLQPLPPLGGDALVPSVPPILLANPTNRSAQPPGQPSVPVAESGGMLAVGGISPR